MLQGLLQGAQGVDVQVVGGLVQQQDVGSGAFSILARWTRLRSPPEICPTFCCCWPPEKLKRAT
jgi:hypothetical protein